MRLDGLAKVLCHLDRLSKTHSRNEFSSETALESSPDYSARGAAAIPLRDNSCSS